MANGRARCGRARDSCSRTTHPVLSLQLCASANLMEKRVSYLCAGLCFAPEHEFRMMLVNRLQRDLQSANVLECAIALSASLYMIFLQIF